jgi:hypothetical protein
MKGKILICGAMLAALAGCSHESKQAKVSAPTATTSAGISSSRAMRGTYRPQDGTFQECGASQAMPVAGMGSEYAFLSEHTKGMPGAQDGAVASVVAHIDNRSGTPMYVIDRVDRIAAGAGISCDSP